MTDPKKPKAQPVSEEEKKKLIEDLRDFEWRGKNLGMIIEDFCSRLSQKEEALHKAFSDLSIVYREKNKLESKNKDLEDTLLDKEEECRRYRKALARIKKETYIQESQFPQRIASEALSQFKS